jgi:hypothetical protein
MNALNDIFDISLPCTEKCVVGLPLLKMLHFRLYKSQFNTVL